MKKYKNIIMIVLFVMILGTSINVFADPTVLDSSECLGTFDESFFDALNKYFYVPVKWATPILLLVLTSVDFAKIVFSGKKEDMDKARKNFLKRFVAGLIIFFAPNIVILIVNFIQNESIKACMSQFVN